ncbi:AAA family ATPase [Danxiaibacter flavus]|uniref:AAA family ATPase n=1 Tax=Danxiaibacter flavus TaxID=3049108 RepID=A0ABV3ZC53_9BACT|nr:AAA family ATPase [Chitinophagaceae bacterium DXS]
MFCVITGGPGAGKTTLIEALQKVNFICMPEVAREIIREQSATNGEGLPWKNRELYAALMLDGSLASYNAAPAGNSIVFFDRGIPDVMCYHRLINLPITAHLSDAVSRYRYNEKVFILPPWPEIYHTDSERKQDWQEAEYTFHLMKQVYEDCGYTPIEVPRQGVEERVEFVKKELRCEV